VMFTGATSFFSLALQISANTGAMSRPSPRCASASAISSCCG
jgi:hypothetical protein